MTNLQMMLLDPDKFSIYEEDASMTNRDLFMFLLNCSRRSMEVAKIDYDDLWPVFFRHSTDCINAAEFVYDPCNV